jgi:hypothetical protein
MLSYFLALFFFSLSSFLSLLISLFQTLTIIMWFGAFIITRITLIKLITQSNCDAFPDQQAEGGGRGGNRQNTLDQASFAAASAVPSTARWVLQSDKRF